MDQHQVKGKRVEFHETRSDNHYLNDSDFQSHATNISTPLSSSNEFLQRHTKIITYLFALASHGSKITFSTSSTSAPYWVPAPNLGLPLKSLRNATYFYQGLGKWAAFMQHCYSLSTTQSVLQYMSTFTYSNAHSNANGRGVPQSANLLTKNRQTDPFTHQLQSCLEQFRVQYSAQKHFDMQTEGVWDQTTDLKNTRLALLPEPQQPIL